MWNKNLNYTENKSCDHCSYHKAGIKSVCTYKEPSPEPLWESIAAFVLMTAGAVALLMLLVIVVG